MISLLFDLAERLKNGKCVEDESESDIDCENTVVSSQVEKQMHSGEEMVEDLTPDEGTEKVFGTVDEIFDDEGVAVIDASGQTHFVRASNIVASNFNIMKGDKVILSALLVEEGFGSVDKLQITSMRLANIRTSVGRVVEMNKDFWVLEESVVLLASYFDRLPDYKVNDVLNYKSVESEVKVAGQEFCFRVVEILGVADIKVEDKVFIRDLEMKVTRNSSSFESKNVLISNKADVEVTLTAFRFEPLDMQFKYKPLESAKRIRAKNGCRQINFTILPRESGRKEYTLIAEFEASGEKFQKQVKLVIDVVSGANHFVPAPLPNDFTCRFVDIRIEPFHVPNELRLINFSNIAAARQELIAQYPFLDEELTSENYINRLSYGVHIEEIAQELGLASFNMQKVRFEECGEKILRLEVPGVAEKRPSIMPGDFITATDPFGDEDSYRFQGRIEDVENDAVKVKFNENFHETQPGKEFNVSFSSSRGLFKKRNHAICKITMNESLGYDFLFPELLNVLESKTPQLDVSLEAGKLVMNGAELPWYDQRLNVYQKKAVVNVLRGECRPTPYIIYGPPGTGKTMTVVELIKQIFFLMPDANILVGTPSNSAANIYVEALVKSQRFKNPHDFIRLVSHNQITKDAIPDGLQRYCATVSIKSDDGSLGCEPTLLETGFRHKLTRSKIINYRICVSTLTCFGNFMQIDFPQNHFTHVIIDEAGQAIEPETLMPLTLLSRNSGQVVLAGDPKQLGPMCQSPFSRNLELDSSMLERLLAKDRHYAPKFGPEGRSYNPKLVTKLKRNYRSHPSVLKLYNDLFYESELEGTVHDDESPEAGMLSMAQDILYNRNEANAKCGVYFVNVVKGVNRKVPESSSWYNQAEIEAVFSFLCKLHSSDISFKEIGVITPYALQVKKLKQKASSLPDVDLKIGTVEEFQGQERQIILLSTVRSEQKFLCNDKRFGLGFLQCEKRINVAISRARALLIVYGKAEILRTNDKWRQLIEYSVKNGTFVSV